MYSNSKTSANEHLTDMSKEIEVSDLRINNAIK